MTDRMEATSRTVTMNQVVAWNVVQYRRAAGLTQAELGERVGISAANLSAAERSVTGKRARNFDAGELAAFALALGVPVPALLMPPRGIDAVTVPGAGDIAPGELFRAALSVPSDDGSKARMAYIRRYAELEAEHMPPLADVPAAPSLLDESAAREHLSARLDRIRGQQAALSGLLDDLGRAEEAVTGNLDDLGGTS